MGSLTDHKRLTHSYANIVAWRPLKLVLWSAGTAVFIWALSDARFRDMEGFLDGEFCLPLTVGLALVVLGCALESRWKRSAFWFALVLVGQAVALQMIEAGPLVRYQHYKSVNHLLTYPNLLLLIYLALQTAFVVAGLKTWWPSVRGWIRTHFNVWQVLAVGLVFLLSSATVSRQVPFYLFEIFFAAFVQAVNLANIVMVVMTLPEEALHSFYRRFGGVFGESKKGGVGVFGNVDRFAMLAAVWVIMFAAMLSFLSYERHPHIPDEVAYLYHARYLADGMVTMPAPPVSDAFDIDLMHYEADRWYSPVPPGWPAILALGVLVSAPWLVNPLLAGLNILLTYLLVREIYDRRTARMAILLLCVSPWYVFMAMNFMTHTFTLTCALTAAVAVAWARRTGKAVWGGVGGIALGMVSLIRPLEGLAMAALLGLWAIGVGGRRLNVSSITALVVGSVVVGSVVFPYNNVLTGDPMKFPIMAYTDKYYGAGSNALGFGPGRGLGWALDPYPGHSPIDALINANLNVFSVNIELFGWSTGSLILIAIMLFSGMMRRSDYLMLGVIGVIVGIHSLYWFSGGPDFGARYWYLIIVPCVALTARGVQFLSNDLESGPAASATRGVRVMVGVMSLSFLTLINYFPWRAIDKYHHYRGMRPDIRYLAQEYDFGKTLVFIRGKRHPDYASAAAYNPVDLYTDEPIYVWDRSPEVRAQLLDAYPERPVWVVEGPSITHGPFTVLAGPVSRQNLIARENDTR